MEQIMSHPFFKKIDWDKMYLKKDIKPPIKVNKKHYLTVVSKNDRDTLKMEFGDEPFLLNDSSDVSGDEANIDT